MVPFKPGAISDQKLKENEEVREVSRLIHSGKNKKLELDEICHQGGIQTEDSQFPLLLLLAGCSWIVIGLLLFI